MTVGIRWYALGPGSGYGDASAAYLAGLRERGVAVSWVPMGWGPNRWNKGLGPLLGADLSAAAHHDIAGLAILADTAVVALSPLWGEELAEETAGMRRVAFTTWETDRLPAEHVVTLNRYDQVLVPSQFNREVFLGSGVTAPVSVVPHISEAVDARASAPGSADTGPFTFYLVASWTTRKAVHETVAAFLEAFRARDEVRLVIHTTPEDLIARGRMVRGEQRWSRVAQQSWFALAKSIAGRNDVPQIELSTRRLSRAGIEALHARGDCFVSLSRGEGWGLGPFDAGRHGRPVVVTGWGGTLEYLPDGYPYCVDFDLLPTTGEDADFWWTPHPGERWAVARIDHAAVILRRIYDQQAEARAWGRLLQGHVAEHFDRKRVTSWLLTALAGIADPYPRPGRRRAGSEADVANASGGSSPVGG